MSTDHLSARHLVIPDPHPPTPTGPLCVYAACPRTADPGHDDCAYHGHRDNPRALPRHTGTTDVGPVS